MRHLALAALAVAMLTLAAALPVAAAPNIYGTSGLIELPDDIIYPVGSFSPAYHAVTNIGSSKTDINFFTVGVGILPRLSVSGGIAANGDTDVVLNGKYRLAPETVDRPSITVGVVDAASQINEENPGIYILFGKNLTAAAEEVAGRESKPLRGYFAVGTGVLKGASVGLNWTLTPKLSAMFEYLSHGLKDDSHFNGGIRYALTNEVRIDLGFFDFEDFTGGISYNLLRY